MTRFLSSHLTRFRKEEDGNAVVPFALWMPVFLALILSSIELGTVTIRQTALERAMDDTVRDIRLGAVSDHNAIKQSICDGAAVLPGCMDTLHLEMVSLDMRNWGGVIDAADCVDTSLPVTPNRAFTNGGSNEMMFLRACYKYQPITPAGTISSSLAKDAEGFTALVVASAFVHEPS
ncbi:pilus assembly protein [Tropicibacter sp. R15_0]|uniref:TadE/TadG family type IV pilus assembly protein n=1 Tax=Tropicibacter sp. R15_0 TaxID=2821101 RepID=UPI001ADD51A3|nr:TadE/TadG family type IV pilus assembly protein [Tropicibacter sp. R15_0]MBO9467699.1 pilus assembly protein [Tropicibacter sp. R15_0]